MFGRERLCGLCDTLIDVSLFVFILTIPFYHFPNNNTRWNLLFSIIIAAWIVKIVLRRRIVFAKTELNLPLFCFIFVVLLSSLHSIDVSYSLHAMKKEILRHVLIYFAIVSNIDDPRRVRPLI